MTVAESSTVDWVVVASIVIAGAAVCAGAAWIIAGRVGRDRPRPVAPLTVGRVLIAIAVAAAGFGVVLLATWAVGVLTLTDAVQDVDRPFLSWMVGHRVASINDAVVALTRVGSYEFTIALGVVVGAWLLVARRWVVAPILLATTWLGILTLQNLLKQLVPGTVPADAIALGAAGPYPSGGAARISGVAVMCAFLLGRAYGDRVARIAWTVAVVLIWCEVISRVYLALHWPVDVVGGVLLGVSWATVLIVASRFLPGPSERRMAADRRPSRSATLQTQDASPPSV